MANTAPADVGAGMDDAVMSVVQGGVPRVASRVPGPFVPGLVYRVQGQYI